MQGMWLSAVLLILCPGTLLWAAEPEQSATQAEFERIAGELTYLSIDGVLFDRKDRIREVEHPERHAELMRQVLDAKYPAKELLALLNHASPKVRTLAASALYHREDPQHLPALVKLCEDQAESFLGYQLNSLPEFSFTPEYRPPTQKQTVARFVRLMVTRYLEVSGNFYIQHETLPDFDDYWAVRKDRTHCAGWFAVQLARAGQSCSPTPKDRIEKIRAVRQRIDRLPPDERSWVLLWLQRIPGHEELVSEAELVAACQQVGREKLLLLLQKKIPSADPDLQTRSSNNYSYHTMIGFVLRHAEELLKPEDSAALLACEVWEREYHERRITDPCLTPWWAVAAARLNKQQAVPILHAALARFQGEYDADDRSQLCSALWELGGEQEGKFLMDWFYQETPERGAFPNCRSRFIEDGAKGPRGRELLAQLIRDHRLPEMDWQSLERLARAVNQWSKTAVVSRQEFEDAWHPLGQGHYHWERGKAESDYPKETAALEAHLTRWRQQLLASVPNWAEDEQER